MKQENIVIIDQVKLTGNLTLQKFAILDRPMEGDQLPEDGFGIYFRVICDESEVTSTICDHSGQGLNTNSDDVFAFFIRNKVKLFK